jgi:hypothetical protein
MIPPESPVCFVAHSHGTRTVSAMLHLLQGGVVEGFTLRAGADAGHRLRAVFAASAIDHDWLNPGKKYGCALPRLEGLVSLRNRHDWVLGLYPLRMIGSSRALGRAGWTRRDHARLGTHTGKLQELDVSPLIGNLHVWPSYYEIRSLAVALAPFIHFTESHTHEAPQPSEPESERSGNFFSNIRRPREDPSHAEMRRPESHPPMLDSRIDSRHDLLTTR